MASISSPKEVNGDQGGQGQLNGEAAGMNAADIEDTDWARAPVDVTTNYKIEKKLTIPLRLFGNTKDHRHIPSSLSRVVAVQHEGGEAYPIELGSLELKYEESHGRTRLHLIGPGASDVLARFRGHRITGWSLCEPTSGAAVMHISPPSQSHEDGSKSEDHDFSTPTDGEEEEREGGKGEGWEVTGGPGVSKEILRQPLKVILRRGNVAVASSGPPSATNNTKVEADGRISTRASGRRATPDPNEIKAEPSEPGMGPTHGAADDEEYQMDEDEVLEGDEDIVNERGGVKDLTARRSTRHRIGPGLKTSLNPGLGNPPLKKPQPGPPSSALVPVSAEGIAGFSLEQLQSVKPSHASSAVLGNNNLSLPQTMFGEDRMERVFPEKCQVLTAVENGLDAGVFDLGIFKLNINPYNPQSSNSGSRMKVTLGASGTLYKRFRDQLSIYGWSKVQDAKPSDENLMVIMAHMKVAVAPQAQAPLGALGSAPAGAGQLNSLSLATSVRLAANITPPHQKVPEGSARPKLASNGGGHKRSIASVMSDDLVAAANTLAFLSDPKRPRITSAAEAATSGDGPRYYEPTIHPAYDFSTGPSLNGLPHLPDLATTSGTAFMTRAFLHIYNLLKLSPGSKVKLMRVIKEILMGKGEAGAAYLECVYSFLQDACSTGDKEAVLNVLKESFGVKVEEGSTAGASAAEPKAIAS